MATIKKKKTDMLTKISAALIKNVDMPDEVDTPLVLFTTKRGDGDYAEATERLLPMTKEAFRRAKFGAGCRARDFKHGLAGVFRYSFIVMVAPVSFGSGDSKTTKPTVVGIHSMPLKYYLDADMGELLKMELDENSAVVDVHPETGELDVLCFPGALFGKMGGFIGGVEKLSSISEADSFTVGSTTYTVEDINGNRVVFSCVDNSDLEV